MKDILVHAETGAGGAFADAGLGAEEAVVEVGAEFGVVVTVEFVAAFAVVEKAAHGTSARSRSTEVEANRCLPGDHRPRRVEGTGRSHVALQGSQAQVRVQQGASVSRRKRETLSPWRLTAPLRH